MAALGRHSQRFSTASALVRHSQDKSVLSATGDSARTHSTRGITRVTITRDVDGYPKLEQLHVKRNVFVRCCRFIYIHGSIIGPAPCSFICICSCSSCCTQKCLGPLNKSSFATKLMYIIFLGFVMLFATFFIIASVASPGGKGLAGSAPCMNAKTGELYHIGGWWGNCRGHAAYFIVYRIFLAFVLLLLFLAICTIGVTTSKDFCRPGLHQGFWLCKFILFFIVSAVTIAFITVKTSHNVSFDETWMYIGSAATGIFSIPQIIFFLELIEQTVIKVKAIKLFDWRIVYWSLTSIVYLFDAGILALLCLYYTTRNPNRLDTVLGDPVDYGFGKFCPGNISLTAYGILVGILLTLAMIWHTAKRSQVYPNVGLLHSALVLAHTVIVIYIALGNCVDVECRIVWYPAIYNPYNLDVALTIEGAVHVVFVSLTIVYFTLIVEITSVTTPLSKALAWVCCKQTPKEGDDLEAQLEFTTSQMEVSEEKRRFLLLNDEAKQLQYSWACFHLFLILGSLSIMMGMTNFIRPMADGPNAASTPGLWSKLVMSPITIFAFLIPIIVAWVKHSRRPPNFDESALSDTTRSAGVSILEDEDYQSPSEGGTAEGQIISGELPNAKPAPPTNKNLEQPSGIMSWFSPTSSENKLIEISNASDKGSIKDSLSRSPGSIQGAGRDLHRSASKVRFSASVNLAPVIKKAGNDNK